jgi:hypothetical protein
MYLLVSPVECILQVPLKFRVRVINAQDRSDTGVDNAERTDPSDQLINRFSTLQMHCQNVAQKEWESVEDKVQVHGLQFAVLLHYV